MKLHWIFNRYMAPVSEGGGGGAAVDRGDDFTPTTDDADSNQETPAAEAAGETDKGTNAEGESGADGEDDKPADKKSAGKRIPLDRHQAILEKEREQRKKLEAQLAQYQNGKEVADLNATMTATEEKVVKLENDYAKLIADGNTDAAAKVMNEIRKLDRQVADAKADMKITAAVSVATERVRYMTTLERIEAAYPQLNQDHDDYDDDLAGDVKDLMRANEARGMTPADALQKAVKRLLGTTTTKQETATEVKARVDEKDVQREVATARRKEAVAKTVAATRATPPNVSKVGLDSDKEGGTISAKDVMKMSFKDFSALPEETLSRMRGDLIE